jgi:hypothetical protein
MGIDAYWIFIYHWLLLIMLGWVWIVLSGYYLLSHLKNTSPHPGVEDGMSVMKLN